MGILVEIFDKERRHLSEKIGDIPPEKAVRIFTIGRGRVKTLPMLSRIIAMALANLIYVQPAWATPYWQTASHEIASKTYASAHFLYASHPDVRTCNPGALSQRAKDRALRAMNQIRALHGLTPVRYSYLYDRSVQEAALIQAANGYPGHHPSSSARCYTTAGAEGSRTSNINGFSRGTPQDGDPFEEIITWTRSAGHRRWVLNPFAAYVSYGHVHGYSAQKTFDFDHEPNVTPFITVEYVAFPYKTYPAILLKDDPPWSFSVVENKTDKWKNKHPYFQLAAVTVTRVSDGHRLPTSPLSMDTEGKGIPNFFSWQVQGWEYDTPYQVTIRNVAMQTRQLRSYSYPVVIDRRGRPSAPVRAVHTPPQPAPQPKVRHVQPRRPRPQKRVATREGQEREARAAARAAKRLREYQ